MRPRGGADCLPHAFTDLDSGARYHGGNAIRAQVARMLMNFLSNLER